MRLHLAPRTPEPHVVAVIPALNVGRYVARVLEEMPEIVGTIIVVDDGSSDDTAAVVESRAAGNPRIHLIRHTANRGVGAAMVTGYRRALELRADIVVKVDGDGQMPLALLPRLIEPLLSGEADYVKGNRFRDFEAIRRMPPLRRCGNVALSFLARAATGYWDAFDLTNGFVAVRGDVLARLPLHRIDPGYYFEISMLSHLYLLGAVVKEEAMPARYEGEPSSLSIPAVLMEFPGRLMASLLRRIVLRKFVYDFSVGSLYIAVGLPLLLAGVGYGGYKWFWHATNRIAAPTGAIVLSAMLILVGFQLLLGAVAVDQQAVPREPIGGSLPLLPGLASDEAQTGASRAQR